jgi:hypothetical protein
MRGTGSSLIGMPRYCGVSGPDDRPRTNEDVPVVGNYRAYALTREPIYEIVRVGFPKYGHTGPTTLCHGLEFPRAEKQFQTFQGICAFECQSPEITTHDAHGPRIVLVESFQNLGPHIRWHFHSLALVVPNNFSTKDVRG